MPHFGGIKMQLQTVKAALEKRGFRMRICATGAEAVAYLNGQIDNTSVGIGGSVTVKELGLFDALSARNEVWWHNDEKQLAEFGDPALRRKARDAKVYISSVNALSADGELVNIDGTGNRIASTAYGHERVYFLVGKNKIAEDLTGAIWRARNIASPKNAQRLGLKTPCAVKGDRCYDCNSPQRICRGLLIIERPMLKSQTEIILIDEERGY